MKEEHNGQFDNKIAELFNGCCKYKKYHWNRVLFSRLYCLHLLMSCIRFTGGSYYTHKGAAVELLCLPRNPEWGIYIDGHDGAKITFMVRNMRLVLIKVTWKLFIITMFHAPFVWFCKNPLLKCFQVSMTKRKTNQKKLFFIYIQLSDTCKFSVVLHTCWQNETCCDIIHISIENEKTVENKFILVTWRKVWIWWIRISILAFQLFESFFFTLLVLCNTFEFLV